MPKSKVNPDKPYRRRYMSLSADGPRGDWRRQLAEGGGV